MRIGRGVKAHRKATKGTRFDAEILRLKMVIQKMGSHATELAMALAEFANEANWAGAKGGLPSWVGEDNPQEAAKKLLTKLYGERIFGTLAELKADLAAKAKKEAESKGEPKKKEDPTATGC